MKRRPLVASLVSSLAAILIFAAGCGEQSPTATRLESTAAAAGRAGVGRRAQPIKARHRAGLFSRTIGPEGGALPFGIGKLVVPPGALSERTRITAYVNGKDLAVEFQPHGLAFRPGHEPKLEISYPDADLAEPHILYFDPAGNVIEALTTSRNPTGRSASALLHHFSAYGLAASL